MIQCPECDEQSVRPLGGASQGRFVYMCSNSDCTYRWSQRRVAPGEDPDVRPCRRAGGYSCRHCWHVKRDPFHGGYFAHICYGDNTGFNKVMTRMIGGNPGYQETGCRAVYLSKRLAALQRVFRAHLYAVRLMPRRKRLLTGLLVLRTLDSDTRRYIMEMSGLASRRTTPPKPFILWTRRHSDSAPQGSPVFVLEVLQSNGIDGVMELFHDLMAAAA
jgi:hypothetical protein